MAIWFISLRYNLKIVDSLIEHQHVANVGLYNVVWEFLFINLQVETIPLNKSVFYYGKAIFAEHLWVFLQTQVQINPSLNLMGV